MDTDDVDMTRLLQSCRERSAIFFERRSHAFAQRALQDLLPEHRPHFFRQLIGDALRAAGGADDADDARLVGALWLLEDTHRLCAEDHAFLRALEGELAALPDTLLDAPHAPRRLAAMLRETPLDAQVLESLVWQAVPPDAGLREKLIAELATHDGAEEGGPEAESRRNRFERTFGEFSAPGPSSAGTYEC